MGSAKIMLIDDNQEFLDELQEILSLCGYSLIATSDGKRAVGLARSKKPDIILLDLKMNEMNGFHVAEKLKQCRQTAHIPIIAMSGYFPMGKDSPLINTSDMQACLQKPFSVSDAITQIEIVLGSQTSKVHVKAVEEVFK
ncbi:MAG: response regulator [Candidatus Omnitrophota bacterium]|jgi:CheY-like chemotaxis protein